MIMTVIMIMIMILVTAAIDSFIVLYCLLYSVLHTPRPGIFVRSFVPPDFASTPVSSMAAATTVAVQINTQNRIQRIQTG